MCDNDKPVYIPDPVVVKEIEYREDGSVARIVYRSPREIAEMMMVMDEYKKQKIGDG